MGFEMQSQNDLPTLDRWRLDELLADEPRLRGAASIAAVLGVHARTLARWLDDPACTVPVRKVGGCLSAYRSELREWQRTGGQTRQAVEGPAAAGVDAEGPAERQGQQDGRLVERVERLEVGDRVVGMPGIAARLGVCVVTARKWSRDTAMRLPVSFVGGRWWASGRKLDAWIAARMGE